VLRRTILNSLKYVRALMEVNTLTEGKEAGWAYDFVKMYSTKYLCKGIRWRRWIFIIPFVLSFMWNRMKLHFS
jgi:hypothetical protein